MYDIYNINLNKIRMRYFPSINSYYQYRSYGTKNKKFFNVIEDFSVIIKVNPFGNVFNLLDPFNENKSYINAGI